jgi:hypothetical protein
MTTADGASKIREFLDAEVFLAQEIIKRQEVNILV